MLQLFAIALLLYFALGAAAGASRGKGWFLWLWIPFFVASLAGCGFGAYCLVQLLGLSGQGGEAAGFAGAPFFLGALYAVPFLIGLIISLFMTRGDGK